MGCLLDGLNYEKGHLKTRSSTIAEKPRYLAKKTLSKKPPKVD